MEKKPVVTITVQKNIEVPISIDQMANWFWYMNTDQRAEFFNSIAKQSADWFSTDKMAMQALRHLCSNPALNTGGRRIINTIAEANPKIK